MIVACPHCSAVYELPKHLLGPGGAAVRCPHCAGEFLLGASGELMAAGSAGASPRAAEAGAAAGAARTAVAARATEATPVPAAPRAGAAPRATETSGAARTAAAEAERSDSGAEAQAVARRVLDELVARKGPAMADASARGRLLSEFGPELLGAFEEFRKEIGGTGNPAPFRDALRERWGLDLSPPKSS